MKAKIFLMIALAALITLTPALAQHDTTIYFFYGDGCPHCAEEKPFLEQLESQYPSLTVKQYEVYNNRENAELFMKFAEAYGETARGVPGTFVGDQMYSGYSERLGEKIEQDVIKCIEDGCVDPWQKYEGNVEENKSSKTNVNETNEVSLPMFGEVNAAKMSLPVLAMVLGFIDGFNPCAFFVLLFLLSMMISLRSRGKMLLVGGIFVFFSGLMYFLFMAAWLNVFLVAGSMYIVTSLAAIVAIFVGLVNIKDYFAFKTGLSLTIPDKAKPKLFKRMRGLLKAESLTSMLIGAVVLAIAANLYELLCTFSFPMVFTRILTLNNLPAITYYMYLLLYNLFYIIPLLVIVIMVSLTLGARKLSESQGRILKLVSGNMMLFLGLVLLFKPGLLNNVFAAVIILFTALIVSGMVLLIRRSFKKSR